MPLNLLHIYYPWYYQERIDNRNLSVLYFYGVGVCPERIQVGGKLWQRLTRVKSGISAS